jgi:hypothetical protein
MFALSGTNMTQEEQDVANRFYALYSKPERLTDEELDTMRRLLAKPNAAMVRRHILAIAQLRIGIDLIESIRQFDEASGDLVRTTNKLTWWILGLTIIAAVLALINAVATGWPWLVWWVSNGFRFH